MKHRLTRMAVLLHLIVGKWCLALDAPLGGEAAVSLDDQFAGDASLALQTVNVLGKEHAEEILLGKQRDKGMRDGGRIIAGIQFFREDIERIGVLAEVGDVEDGLGVWEVQTREVRVQAGIW